MRIAITGGSSNLAKQIGNILTVDGHSVELLSRSKNSDYYELSNFSSNSFSNSDVVIHLAHDFKSLKTYKQIVDEVSLFLKESKQINILISSMSAHKVNESNYSHYKTLMESSFLSSGAHVIRPGIVINDGGNSPPLKSLNKLKRFLRFYPLSIPNSSIYFLSSGARIVEDIQNIIISAMCGKASIIQDSFILGPLDIDSLRRELEVQPILSLSNIYLNLAALRFISLLKNYVALADKILNFARGMSRIPQ